MGTSKTAITPRNIGPWMAALGFIFPTSPEEVARFERLYAEVVIPEDELLDPDIVLGIKVPTRKGATGKIANINSFDSLRMAARNGKGPISQHILDKMKKNQKKPNTGNDGTEEKAPD